MRCSHPSSPAPPSKRQAACMHCMCGLGDVTLDPRTMLAVPDCLRACPPSCCTPPASPAASASASQGRALYIKLGDKEVEYNRAFRLVLHTKLSSPHYPPEVQVGGWVGGCAGCVAELLLLEEDLTGPGQDSVAQPTADPLPPSALLAALPAGRDHADQLHGDGAGPGGPAACSGFEQGAGRP